MPTSAAPPTYRRTIRALGAAILLGALAANPWILARLLSSDGAIEHPLFIGAIISGEVLLAACGLYLMLRPRRASVFNLLLLCAACCVSLLAAEFGARVMVYGTHAFSWRDMASLRTFGEGLLVQASEDPGLRFELKPDLDVLYRFVGVRTNDAGMRDDSHLKQKTEGVFRVAVLGDSFTFPVGVEIADAYHTLLEQRLKVPGYERVECLNFAVPGYYLRHYPDVLARRAMAYQPDLIVVGFCAENDHIPPPPGLFEQPFAPAKEIHPFFRSTLATLLYYAMHPSAGLDKTPTHDETVYMRREFGRLKQTADGVPVVVAFLANIPRDGSAIRHLAEEAGLEFVDCSAGFKTEEIGAMSIFHPVDSHPNARANARFADTIGAWIDRMNFPGQ